MIYRSFVDFDVRARTIADCMIDEVVHRRFRYDLSEMLECVRSLSGPATTTFEAGSTRLGPFRLLESSAASGVWSQLHPS